MPITFLDEDKEVSASAPTSGGSKITFLDEEPAEEPGALGSFGREAVRSVVPGITATAIAPAAARVATALVPTPLKPVAGVLGALGVAAATGMGVRKAQDVVADEVAPESMLGTKSAQADFEANPIASFGGSLIGMGRPSLSQPMGIARAIGTAEGRAGVAQVAKSLANKDARTALTQAVEAGEPGARRAMEDFGNLLGGAAGFGAQAGMEVAQGRDLPTAAAMGVAGLAVKPWVGPGGVFLNGQKPKAPSAIESTPEAAPVEDGTPLETPATPEEQQLVDDAIAGKVRSVEALDKAANVAEATGTLSQTAAALLEQAETTAAKPVVSPDQQVVAETPEPAGPTVTNAARAYADKLGVDVSQVPANRNNKVTKADIDRWRKTNQTAPAEKTATPANDNLAQQEGAASSSGENKSIPGWKSIDIEGLTDEEFLAKMKEAYGASSPETGTSSTAPKAAPKAAAARPDPTRVPDETLLAGVAQSKTKEEFVNWAKQNGYGETLRPASGGFIMAKDFWSWNRPSPEAPAPEAAAPEAAAPAAPAPAAPPAPLAVAPEAPPAALPVAPEAPKTPPVAPEAPPVAPEELVNTDLEVFPMQGNRDVSGVNVQNVSNSQVGLGLSPFRQNRFNTPEEAERALGDFDRVQFKDFSERVHNLLGSGVNESAKANTRISLNDALVNLPDGFAASSLSRYSGASGMNWMKTIETLKAVKSGNPVDLFKQRSGGVASLYEIATDTKLFNYVNSRLSEVGLKGATLVKNPETGSVQVYVLVKNPEQSGAALNALKRFVQENNYGKIKVYKGDAESIGADTESATARLRESLGQYTSGGGRDRAGGPDRLRIANELGGLAREVGIDLGPIPEYEAPRLDARGRPLKDRATSVFQYERDLAELRPALESLPADKQAKLNDLFTKSYDFLNRALGLPRMQLKELGSLLENRAGNDVFEAYAERLRKLYPEEALVPDLVARRNNFDRETDYGASFDQAKAFPKYAGYGGSRDSLARIALGNILADLVKRADDKPIPARKTKSNLAKLEALDKQIAKLQEQTSRADRTPRAVKDRLRDLQAQREAAANQSNPWTMAPAEFNKYVEGKLDNALKATKTVEANAEKAGAKVIEDTVISGDDKENKSLVDVAAAPEENPNAGIDIEVKKAAYEALRNEDVPQADKVAIVKRLVTDGSLSEAEMRALKPDTDALESSLAGGDKLVRDGKIVMSNRERGSLIADNYSLEQILRKEHRNEKGKLVSERLLSPMEEAAVPVDRDAPPQVIRETNAREFLAELLDSKTISGEDSALIRRLLDEANVDNIPLRIYDYLENAYGEYDRRSGVVGMNAETLTPERGVETGLHEITHGLLGYVLNPRNSASLNARQRQAVRELNRFFERTTEAAIKDGRFTREQLEAVRAMTDEGVLEFPTDQHREAYRFSNVDEWTAAMMSESGFRDYMKGLKMRNTVTGKWREAWETFKDLVARLFGVDRSVYKKSFDRIMELATDSEAGRPSGMRGVSAGPRESNAINTADILHDNFKPLTPESLGAVRRLSEDQLRELASSEAGVSEVAGVSTSIANRYAAGYRLRTEFGNRIDYSSHIETVQRERIAEALSGLTPEQRDDIRFSDDDVTSMFGIPLTDKVRAVAYNFDNDFSPMDYSPIGGKPRSTRKVSEAQVNERLSDKDKVMFDSQQVPAALQAAMNWKSNGGRLQDLPNSTLSNPEVLQAAELFYEDAMAVKASVDRMKNPSAKDLAARRAAEDDLVESMQLVGRMVSEAGKTLGHSQYVGSRRTINIQDVYKTLLGRTPEQMAAEGSASGKIDLQRLSEGIRQIKAKAADTTMLALEADLKQAGIEGAENLGMVRDTLAHPSSNYRDLLATVADLMPANSEAQTRALAERIFKIYTLTANNISKTNLPEIVAETYNGQSTTPATDKFLKKLSEFVKLGKYSEDEINSTVLEALGLSGYDKEFIASIRKDLFKIAVMPEGQMRDAASVAVNQKVKTKLYNNVLKSGLKTSEDRKHAMDMLTSAWQAGVLSGPPTSLVNLLGSATSTTVESFMEGFGYALKTGDVRYLGDVYSGFISALFGNKATGRASSALAEGKSALTGQGTKYRNESIGDTPILENIDTTGTSAPVKLLGGYAQKLRYVGRVMSALDAINMSMADEAKQRMVARFFLTESKGHRAAEVADMMHKLFDPDEVVMTNARKRAEEDVKTYLSDKSAKEQERWVTRRTLEILTQQREELVPNIAEAGRGAAERFTYNETAKGFIGKTMVNLSAQINETLPAGRFVLSFMNTLANIMNQTLDYTPYGYLRAKNKWRVGTVDPNTKYARRVYKEGSPEQMAQIARASLGTSIMMTLGYLAYKGYEDEQNGETPYFTVTGAGPKNSFDKQQLIDTGAWRPNSVKIGNTWYRYMDFPILGAALGFMGTMLDAARYKKDDQTNAEVVWDAALAGATTVFDKQLFQGANNFFEMLRGGQPGQQVYAMKKLVGGTIGGFTNPGMARWLRNTLDMDSKGMVDRLDQKSTAGWVASMIPFSIGYNTAALNTLGEPIQQPWYSATTWRFADFDKSKPHPIITPLIQAGLMLPNPSPSTQFRVLNPSDGTILKTRLGKYPEIMRRFVELRGQALKQILTPEAVANLQQAARQNQDAAQDYLDSKIGGAAREFAVRQIEQEILDGKLKL